MAEEFLGSGVNLNKFILPRFKEAKTAAEMDLQCPLIYKVVSRQQYLPLLP